MAKKKSNPAPKKKAARKDVKLARTVLKSRIALLGKQLRGKAAAKLQAGEFDKLYRELQTRTADLAKLR